MNQLNELECITLFVEDLMVSKKFYHEIFGLKIIYEDADSCVVRLNNLMLNLLKIANAATLVAPFQVAKSNISSLSSRMIFTIKVTSVDQVIEELRGFGVTMLNGPFDRPWGRRTASFTDPDHHIWEIAQDL